MAFIDEYHFVAKAGDGGDGVVRFLREKFRPFGGPSGGNGGKGGDVYFEAIRDIRYFSKVSQVHKYNAEDGEEGGAKVKTGKGGGDVYIKLPIGSLVKEQKTGLVYELIKEGEKILVLKGGKGGLGNEHFKSSSNQAPREFTKGEKGEEGVFNVELRLIADIGFVGFPNAGKTSIVNALTDAGGKVGEYPFTTLDPNLGVYYGIILADIPGIIEGASEGRGLGLKFLKHIARTRFLIHCISLEQENLGQAYSVIQEELKKKAMLEGKIEYILFTKTDMCEDEGKEKIKIFKKEHPHTNILPPTSILNEKSIKDLGDVLVSFAKGE
jgi:GTPase